MVPQLLETKESIQGALAMMNPAAKGAALLFAERIYQNPELLQDSKAAFRECCGACAVSLAQFGIDARTDPERFELFFMEHGNSVMHVTYSIVHLAVKEHERQRAWGVVGKVACMAVGVALGAWIS